ncbi:hypothetical protein PF003_g28676 [Phytophthora fragariae]|nr:hypothetical protein PF003_g28676 [Phytophthora fragariae]
MLKEKFTSMRLVHVKREYNQAADYLTSKTLALGTSWQTEDPEELKNLVQVSKIHEKLMKPLVIMDESTHHQQETQSIRDEASHAQGLLEADFARLARENLEETAALRQRNDDLESQLRYAQSQISTLEQRVRDKRFDVDGLLAFLNTGNNEVRGNWPRFRNLLGQFQRGVAAPPSWKTWITVEAADKSFRMIPPLLSIEVGLRILDVFLLQVSRRVLSIVSWPSSSGQ